MSRFLIKKESAGSLQKKQIVRRAICKENINERDF